MIKAGILGGGQLGRMLLPAHLHIFVIILPRVTLQILMTFIILVKVWMLLP